MKIKSGVENWQILQALVNGAKPLGLGHFAPGAYSNMSDAHAKELCLNGSRFDYVCGKPIKTNIGERPMPDFFCYDRDAGQGAAERALRAAGHIED